MASSVAPLPTGATVGRVADLSIVASADVIRALRRSSETQRENEIDRASSVPETKTPSAVSERLDEREKSEGVRIHADAISSGC